MKYFFFGILTVLFIAGLALGAYYLGTKNKPLENNQIAAISPTTSAITKVIAATVTEIPPTIQPSPATKIENDAELIKTALFKKNNWPANENLNVTISTNDGTYVAGSVGGEGGGGYFYAEKVNGVWEIVADGNGTISCSIFTKYPNFPKTLIPECYDETTQDVVKR
jgi:hypothetical protein